MAHICAGPPFSRPHLLDVKMMTAEFADGAVDRQPYVR
jgi:hypothetical protein